MHSGIGEALAHEFYALGCKVVLCARRVGELERVRRNLLNTKLPNGLTSIRPEIVPLDLGDLNQLPDKAHNILRRCLHVDILINNGGVSLRSDALSVKKEVDVQLMNVNYLGAITLTKGQSHIQQPLFTKQNKTIVCYTYLSNLVNNRLNLHLQLFSRP